MHHNDKVNERFQEKRLFNMSQPFDYGDMDIFVVSSAHSLSRLFVQMCLKEKAL